MNGLVTHFGSDAFDIVTATELVEHTRDWRNAISNLKRVTKPGGKLIITTRSHGYPFHADPFDFWRYEPADMAKIFDDFVDVRFERDSDFPGRLDRGDQARLVA